MDTSIIAVCISGMSCFIAGLGFIYKIITDSRDRILERIDVVGEKLNNHLIDYSDNNGRHDQMLHEIVKRQERSDRDSERMVNRIRVAD